MTYTENYYQVNQITLHAVEAGEPQNPVILFLHGFPEFWYSWRHQIPFFSEQGYRVIVPDQRGYNLSSKPASIGAYTLDTLVQDIVELIGQVSEAPVYVVGHDWGAAVAWKLAETHPELVQKLVILNVPHPKVLMQTLKKSIRQLFKSWYIGFFQLPELPEKVLSAGNFTLLARTLTQTSNPGSFTETDITEYKKAWRHPQALQSMIHWYRALRKNPESMQETQTITIPVLILWGAHDIALRQSMAHDSLTYCQNGQLLVHEDATHWIHQDQSAFVNEQILRFIGGA